MIKIAARVSWSRFSALLLSADLLLSERTNGNKITFFFKIIAKLRLRMWAKGNCWNCTKKTVHQSNKAYFHRRPRQQTSISHTSRWLGPFLASRSGCCLDSAQHGEILSESRMIASRCTELVSSSCCWRWNFSANWINIWMRCFAVESSHRGGIMQGKFRKFNITDCISRQHDSEGSTWMES